MQGITILILVGAAMFLILGLIPLLAHIYNLNGIKSKTVGDGQHGTARFASHSELRRTYKEIPFEPELWRQGQNRPKIQGIVVGCREKGGGTIAMVDEGDVHCMMIGAAGCGKTAFFLYPNIEFACACGMSFLSTDTKGDVARNYGKIARDYYGYNVALIDLRNPTRSDGNNLLHLVNKYMDIYLANPTDIAAKAKAEKYAKITAKTIVSADGDNANYGQNAFFYDAAEGLLTASILLIAEFAEKNQRHIVSVFKLIQDLLAPSGVKGKNQFQLLMEKMPNEHKAKWFAGAALNTGDQAMQSVMSTALSRLNSFLDSELEQILCFDTAIDAERFCHEKSALFVIMPEEDPNKFFMISLIIQQLYREILSVADATGGKLENRVMFYADEFGTLPPISSAEMMYSASRSRRLSIISVIQSHQQLEKNYGREGAAIIIDNCQLTIAGGFAPGSESAEIISKAMGSRTVMSGSVSRSKNDPSQSLQMIERPLMAPAELKSMKKGRFIVLKTGANPFVAKLKLFFKWGIKFDEKDPYTVVDKGARPVAYVSKPQIEDAIVAKFPPPASAKAMTPGPKAGTPPTERRRMPPRPRDADNADNSGNAGDTDSDGAGAEMTPSRKRNVGGTPKFKT
ncbi:MAG: type IV secretory system conjugative DNA transfer family protein [Oscillospiraceae bacterium]|jgi:type IV secretion system protein VirD4|nr:type IV secretory system conjugative DNA transfer family protein [Oscillospiraceae bacterium]